MIHLFNRMNEFDNKFNKFNKFNAMMVAWSTSNTSYPQLRNG